jgi:Zn-dependent M28 family amino/carboxypeptidase
MRWKMSLAMLALLPATVSGQIQVRTLVRDAVVERLNSLSPDNDERVVILKKMFQAAGCEKLTEEAVKHEKQPNIVCVLPGQTDSIIVVGAHLDKVHDGTGAVDDWSGSAMLPSLFESLKEDARKHTYVFVAFSGEEHGLVGSDSYVQHLSKPGLNAIAAMVNLECLGTAPTEVWYTHSDRHLSELLAQTAAAVKLPISVMNVDHVGNDDSDNFRNKKIPNVTLHSLTQQTFRFLHTREDTIDKINTSFYYDSYRLAAAYLAVLDTMLPTTGTAAASSK